MKSPQAAEGGTAVGEGAELANPSGFPELPTLNLFSLVEVSNRETFLSMFPLLRSCDLPSHTPSGWLPASILPWS